MPNKYSKVVVSRNKDFIPKTSTIDTSDCVAGKRSKLELYVDTLQALAYSGPANLNRLTTRTKINSNPLRVILNDLTRKGLIIGRCQGRTTLYFATSEARTVLLRFKELNEIFPAFNGKSI